jgi:hypothetical protein
MKLKNDLLVKDKYGNAVKIIDIIVNVSDEGKYSTDIFYWLGTRNGENGVKGLGTPSYKIEPNKIGFMYKLPINRFIKHVAWIEDFPSYS